jgi:conjugal transfer pilus assembly protein TraW
MNRILLITSIIISITQSVFASDLGKFGRTYPVLEPDGIEEMKNAAKQVDWGKYFNKETMEKAMRDYRPPGFVSLPKAPRERVRQVDLSYTTEFDVIDPSSGKTIYPKGFTFNPLDYITFHKKVVVIDGSDQEQIEWFKQSRYAKDPMTVLHITGGLFYEVSESLKRPAFFATSKITRRLELEYVPSVAYQNLRMMEVVEINVNKKTAD